MAEALTTSTSPLLSSAKDQTLHNIVQGVETQTGERFFESLIEQLAKSLGVQYAYVSELTETEGCYQLKAGWSPHGLLSRFPVLPGGPCESVLNRNIVHHPENLAALYPAGPLIKEWNVTSYYGVPLIDSSNTVVGHLAVLDDKPMPQTEETASVMRIFASRLVAEIERARLDQALRKSNLILRLVDEGTATTSGEAFFQALARNLAAALGVRYAFVGELLKEGTRVKTLAFWEGQKFIENFEYDLAGTPCEKVIRGEICHFAHGVQTLFPNDQALVELQAEGYLAIPLIASDGTVLGHLAALDVKPMSASPQDYSIFKIFAARAATELARMRLEESVHRGELILRKIVEGTAATTGDQFFQSLVKNLASALDVRYAFVSEMIPNETKVRTLAFWTGEGFLPNFEYELEHSPCKQVLAGEICHFPERIQQLFPHEEGLVELGAESYLAIPLVNQAGDVLGHLAALDVRPMPMDARLLPLFRIFGARAGAELERQTIHARLAENEERLRDLFDEAPIAYVHEGVDTRFIRANRAAMNILGITPEEVPHTFGKTFIPDTPDAQRRLQDALAAMGRGTDTGGVVLELRRKDNGKPLWIQWWSKPDPSEKYTRTMFLDITDRILMEQEKAKLEAQNTYLREEIQSVHNFEELIGESPALKTVLRNVERVAPTDSTVLITGETGTGKELMARAIHNLSPRKTKPLVKVNCAAIPSGLIESELFGHEKGAFTGALSRKIGRFELADGGTIFLDEIGEIPLDVQSKLLRVLQEGEFERVGGTKTIQVHVRVIAATNRELAQETRAGRFRPDLYYRLNVFPLALPSLRERKEDIPLLAEYFVQKYAARMGKKITGIPEIFQKTLISYGWPGNIRELEHVIERAVILSEGKSLQTITIDSQPVGDAGENEEVLTLEACERRHIEQVLEQVGWKISGPGGAAVLLGLRPTTLEARMKKLGLSRKK
ncbi:sigma 54-interacting transcriptional regulator [Candidatus Nitrospira neomarina]|uniref:Sigma 54-interacting transcriptional regulator n=1 Tax=Candidatus Nitrospira neomarina TaxID=3020899 RepID=A0AA96GPS0_9BACT|nr:sigma 54-interacting transcriptional regulator [Candidatus Nitrospira neomarina]WNM64130.1 sigma 54-interacting transcriptional regulator [Candidatus Nitrospira neomarina]